MPTKNEAICMAVIKNSTVTNIDWEGVAKDLGVGTGNAANCQWRRFKKNFIRDDAPLKKPVRAGGRKKEAIEDMMEDLMNVDDDGEEGHEDEKQPEKKAKRRGRPRKIKTEMAESDGEEEVVGGGNEEDIEDNDWV